MVSAAQAVAQNLNSMTTSIQQLRTQAEQGIASDVQTANTALQQIAQINQQLEAAPHGQRHGGARGPARPGHHAAHAADERQRGAESNNQISVFTGTGQQLVSGVQASQLIVQQCRHAVGELRYGAPIRARTAPARSRSPRRAAATTDLVATNAIQSGEIGAYLQMRDTILPQAQNQLDEMANQMSQALSNQTTSGTAVTSGAQSGFSVDVGGVSAGQHGAAHLYRFQQHPAHRHHRVARRRRHAAAADHRRPIRTIRSSASIFPAAWVRSCRSSTPRSDPTCNFRIRPARCCRCSSQRQRQRRQFAVGDLDRDLADQRQPAAAAVYRRQPADHRRAYRERLADHGACRPHRRSIRALVASPSSLVAYAPNTAAGDPTRPNFMLNQMTNATLTYSPTTGIGSATRPIAARSPNI